VLQHWASVLAGPILGTIDTDGCTIYSRGQNIGVRCEYNTPNSRQKAGAL
jgi:hypothetical protein